MMLLGDAKKMTERHRQGDEPLIWQEPETKKARETIAGFLLGG